MADAIDLMQLQVFPLAARKSLARLEKILIAPDSTPPPCPPAQLQVIEQCARQIAAARQNGASVMLIYGAHLIRNGAGVILARLLEGGWVSHLATNGAGIIHDWEF